VCDRPGGTLKIFQPDGTFGRPNLTGRAMYRCRAGRGRYVRPSTLPFFTLVVHCIETTTLSTICRDISTAGTLQFDNSIYTRRETVQCPRPAQPRSSSPPDCCMNPRSGAISSAYSSRSPAIQSAHRPVWLISPFPGRQINRPSNRRSLRNIADASRPSTPFSTYEPLFVHRAHPLFLCQMVVRSGRTRDGVLPAPKENIARAPPSKRRLVRPRLPGLGR
jgi:hypothetical protein